MLVTPFGSCRINDIEYSSNVSTLLSFTHCTKEVIQLIQYVKGELELGMFCFRTSIEKKSPLSYDATYKTIFDTTDIFVVEITSMKKYEYNGQYLSHMAVDTRLRDQNYKNTPSHIIEDTRVTLQTDEEIEQDILDIQKMLYPRPMIIVTHVDVCIDGRPLQKRHHLITLLEHVCKKHGIMCINPTHLLSPFEQSDVMEPDLGHYLPIARHIVHRHINLCVSYLMAKRR